MTLILPPVPFDTEKGIVNNKKKNIVFKYIHNKHFCKQKEKKIKILSREGRSIL